ncbi:hypothetical protein OJJOAM_002923 [Cupriavidus sp. H18C1]
MRGALRELEGAEGIDFTVLGAESGDAVALLPDVQGFEARSAALARLARRLAAHNLLRGWRDEPFAVTPALAHPAFATIERAAARYFGLLTFASHMNGIVAGQRALWIARRSESKAVDPGMWDNLVAGGMPHGSDPLATLVRECDEESGIPPWLAAQAQAHGEVQVLREIDEGVQWETVYQYDLELPADFVPHNRDGEVAEHRLVGAGRRPCYHGGWRDDARCHAGDALCAAPARLGAAGTGLRRLARFRRTGPRTRPCKAAGPPDAPPSREHQR